MCVTMCGGYLYCRWGMDLLWWMDFTAWWESTGAAHDEKVFQLAPRLYLRNYLRNLQSIPRTLQRDEFAMCVTVCGGYLYCRWGMDLLWWMGEISRFSRLHWEIFGFFPDKPQKLPEKPPEYPENPVVRIDLLCVSLCVVGIFTVGGGWTCYGEWTSLRNLPVFQTSLRNFRFFPRQTSGITWETSRVSREPSRRMDLLCGKDRLAMCDG